MIDTWSEPQRPDYAKVLREREEARERTRRRHQREQEALEWERQQKAQAKRDELWAWYADYDVADSFAAKERAQEAEAARMVREQIKTEVLITEVENAVHERYADGQNPCDTYVVARG